MNFDLDDDQIEFASLAADFFGDHTGLDSARARLYTKGDPAPNFSDLVDLGLPGLLVPAEFGGLDQSVLELAVVAEQGGRVLSAPSMSTFARVSVLLHDQPELLTQFAAGTHRFCVLDGDPNSSDPSIDAQGADRFLALDGTRLVVGGGQDHGFSPIDASRGLSRISLTDSEGLVDNARDRWDRARDLACVILAAEDLGTAQAALDMAVEHAGDRETFGRAIGSYQSLKHRLVDVWAGIDQLRSLVWWAAWTADAHRVDLPRAASAAKAYAARVVEEAADVAVHVHGGLGFTWEHDSHLYWRRAKVDRHLLGSRTYHLDRVARLSLEQHRTAGGSAAQAQEA